MSYDTSKATSYKEAGEMLLESIELNNIQIHSWNHFINNVLPNLMNKTYSRQNFSISFENWSIDNSITLPEKIAMSKGTSHEAAIETIMKITITNKQKDSNEPNQVKTVENIIYTPLTLTKFPLLTNRGTFIVNGIEKVLYSHSEKAHKIFLIEEPCKTRILKQKLILESSNFQRVMFEPTSATACNIEIYPRRIKNMAKNSKMLTSLVNKLNKPIEVYLRTMKITSDSAITELLGETNLTSKVIKNMNLDSTDEIKDFWNYLYNFEMNNAERYSINERLSFRVRLTNEISANTLSDKNGNIIVKAGEKISLDTAEKLQRMYTKVDVKTEFGTFPVYNNNFVPIDEYIHFDELPAEFKFHSSNGGVTAVLVDRNVIESVDLSQMTPIERESFLSVNFNALIGSSLTESDLKGMMNLYSMFTEGVVEPDDIDSLSNKIIVNIATIFETYMERTFNSILDKLITDHNNKILTSSNTDGSNRKLPSFDYPTLTKSIISNELLQAEDNVNPLAETSHRRKLSSLKVTDRPGGVSAESPNPTPRNLNPSHLGRVCCIESPEGKNIGLVSYLATLGKVNEWGFIEAPFFKVDKTNYRIDYSKPIYMTYDEEMKLVRAMTTRVATEDKVVMKIIKDSQMIDIISKPIKYHINEGKLEITNAQAVEWEREKLEKEKQKEFNDPTLKVVTEFHRKDWFIDKEVDCVKGNGVPYKAPWNDIDVIITKGEHIFSPVSSSIVFSHHNDATRNLMGDAMQKQAIPILGRQIPFVGSRIDEKIVQSSNGVIVSPVDGVVVNVSKESIDILPFSEGNSGEILEIPVEKFKASVEKTLIMHRPIVKKDDIVFKGQVIADGINTLEGRTAIGTNLLTAFMSWDGYNYEDSILISDRLIKEDVLTSYHLEPYSMVLRGDCDTKVPQNIQDLRGLDTDGVIRIGTQVKKDMVLMAKNRNNENGRIELKEVKYEGEIPGIVVDKKVSQGLTEADIEITVYVLTEHKAEVGDKLAGRHGNKGIISRILPEADMPYLEDGTPVDIVLTPLGIPSRMNIGQVIENQLGLALNILRYKAVTSPMDLVDTNIIRGVSSIITKSVNGKMTVYDGRTGEKIESPVNIGISYIMKLKHKVSEKLHARSTGNMSQYTALDQPHQGKRRYGGQRLGEMEMWALEAQGAANVMQEILAFKTDDVTSRKLYNKSISKHKLVPKANPTTSLKYTMLMLKAMGKNVEFKDETGKEIDIFGGFGKPKKKFSQKNESENFSNEVLNLNVNSDFSFDALDNLEDTINEEMGFDKNPSYLQKTEEDVLTAEGFKDLIDIEDAISQNIEEVSEKESEFSQTYDEGDEDDYEVLTEEEILRRKKIEIISSPEYHKPILTALIFKDDPESIDSLYDGSLNEEVVDLIMSMSSEIFEELLEEISKDIGSVFSEDNDSYSSEEEEYSEDEEDNFEDFDSAFE